MRVSLGNAGLRPLLAFVAALGVPTAGAPWDKVRGYPPPLVGPAETGISVQLTALPDTVNADGVSQSTVQLVLRYSDGSPFSGLAVYFAHDGDGVLGPSPEVDLRGPGPDGHRDGDRRQRRGQRRLHGGHRSSDGDGVRAPNNIDGASYFERTVEILQR